MKIEVVEPLDLAEKRLVWREEPSRWTASDLLSTVPFVGRDRDTDAAAALLTSEQELPPGMKRQLTTYLAQGESHTPQITNEIYHRRAIARLRNRLRVYPANPLLHVEVARQYVTLGQSVQAHKAIRRALALAPFNRYVVRSAIRFFLHEEKPDLAWRVVRSAPSNDPWLAASKITVAELVGQPQESLRTARSLMDSKDPGQTTELSAAVATLELTNGAFKQARKLFRDSAQSPTDNTVAQLRWARDKAGIPFDERLLETDLSFEARAGQSNKETKWQEALDNTKLWQLDEPFSRMSANLGCYLSSEILRDFESTEEIASLALLSMPLDPTILNNRAFGRISRGDLEGGEADLINAFDNSPSTAASVVLFATKGCLLYRQGDPVGGAEFYQRSVNLAAELKDVSTLRYAYIHWLAEDVRTGGALQTPELEELKKTLLDGKDVTDRTREVLRVNLDAAFADRDYREGVRNRALTSVAAFKAHAAAQFRIGYDDEAD